jgi:hypothetical protein
VFKGAMMNGIPSSNKEWAKLVWAHCRDCNGRKGRSVLTDCNNDKCKLNPVYTMPRKIELKFDFSEYIPEIIEIGISVYHLIDSFQISEIKSVFYKRHGQARLNWGRIVQRREWLAVFETCGEAVSINHKSHGDKVKLWKLKQS